MKEKGSGFIEVIIGASIIILIVVAFALAVKVNVLITSKNSDQNQAALLTEEAGEALQFLRDQNWSENILILNDDADYYLYWNGTNYEISATQTETNNGFLVKIIFDEVYRDAGDSIAESGTLDENTRKATISVYKDILLDPIIESEMLLHNNYEE